MQQATTSKFKLATVWLDGCSGCHMSFLDMDERLLALKQRVELVYSPLVDVKEFPPDADITLVEGAVSTVDDLAKILRIRARTRMLVALGDCAVTGNVPGLRNLFGTEATLDRAFRENVDVAAPHPPNGLPVLLSRVRPVHEVVKVDLFIPGCPPPADAIYSILCDVLDGRTPDVSALTRFGR
jgi:NAD-reducing hydrogenase small subunit